jgi:hypothetical protein
MRTIFTLLMLVIGLVGFGQTVTIMDLDFQSNFESLVIDRNTTGLVYKVATKKRDTSLFRAFLQDSLLNVKANYMVELPGKYTLLAAGSNGKYLYSVFGHENRQDLILYSINFETGEERSTFQRDDVFWNPRFSYRVVASREYPEEFLLVRPVNNRNQLLVRYNIEVAGWKVWSHSYKGEIGHLKIGDIFESEDLVMVVKEDGVNKSKLQYNLLVYGKDFGQEVENLNFYDVQKNMIRSIDNSFYLKSGGLMVWGRIFDGKKIKDGKPATHYYQYFDFLNKEISPEKIITDPLYNSEYIFWMDMYEDEMGVKHLYGESFKSDDFGVHMGRAFLTGVMTFGLLYLDYTSMEFKKVVHMRIFPDGSHSAIDYLDAMPRKFSAGGWWPSYSLVKLAIERGQIRYWGRNPQNIPYVHLKGEMNHWNVERSNELTLLGDVPKEDSKLIVFCSDTYVTHLIVKKLSGKIEYKITPLVTSPANP